MKYVLHGYLEEDGYARDVMTTIEDSKEAAIIAAHKSILQKTSDLVVIIRKHDGTTWTIT